MPAAPTPESNLASLQAIYQQVLANIAAAEASSAPNITVGGVSVDRVGYLDSLYRRRESLGKIPGVAQTPVWTLPSTAR